ncbi:hypothetical protein FA09DRAFT_294690 [Tilletiopsis washingtonensis]|uniref:Mediator of RNA polymerase II transcription subunit 10 n=1 Tax=Tilletiopsis washingtonensis TaxID=58919 RepID=A0A316ZIQ3_9BASI|nr:hypothetical protein FA09DRAFT_294690 [Tilletiopsis washingtonensis]PWO00206.1 hypothetical protein FA09DRAFT_294690 [Tilletiopsis washingtonensis]
MASAARRATPLSPSPSPEPQDGAGASAAAAAAAGASSDAQRPPSPPPDANERARRQLETATRAAVDALYQLAVCTADVHEGQEGLVGAKINSVVAALGNVSATGSSSELTAMVPDDVMGMIDQGRNPDAHTRTFISRLVADNQQMASMTMALDAYHDRLSESLSRAFPELAQPIAQMRDGEEGQTAAGT